MTVLLYASSAVVVAIAGVFLMPDLWRAGLAQTRVWLTPDRSRR